MRNRYNWSEEELEYLEKILKMNKRAKATYLKLFKKVSKHPVNSIYSKIRDLKTIKRLEESGEKW